MANAVKPIPEQYRSLTPNLVCRNASAAIDFYKKALGATEVARMVGPDGKIMHAELKVGDSLFFLNDPMGPGASQSETSAKEGGNAIALHLYVPDADKVFNSSIEAGARQVMPIANMFWGDRYGVIMDPYGHQWGIATHVEDVTPEDMGRRQKEFFAKAARGA